MTVAGPGHGDDAGSAAHRRHDAEQGAAAAQRARLAQWLRQRATLQKMGLQPAMFQMFEPWFVEPDLVPIGE